MMRRTTHPRLSSGSTRSAWLSFLNLPAPLPCWGPQEGCADLLPALGTEKARGQGLPGHSSVESLQISFTRWKLLTRWKSWVSEPTGARRRTRGCIHVSTKIRIFSFPEEICKTLFCLKGIIVLEGRKGLNIAVELTEGRVQGGECV